MGSKFSRAAQPHVKAVASPVANKQQESANGEGKRQDCAPWPPNTFAYDDLNTTASITTAHFEVLQPCISQRRNSAPASTSAAATDNSAPQLQKRMEEFNLFVAAHRLMSIHYAGTDPTPAPAPVVTMPPPPPPAVQVSPPEIRCLICCEKLHDDKEVIWPCRSCANAYCSTCVRNMFIRACTDMSRMPPRCCAQIQLHHAKPYLTPEETAEFKFKYEEWLTPRPFYCPVPTCSTFIPERLQPEQTAGKGKSKRIDSGIGTPAPRTFSCPTCNAGICANCRQTAHPDSTCKIVHEFSVDPEIADLLKSWGYKQCPKCGHGVKRMYGCSHMECRCGAHFCWVCLSNREECYDECTDGEDDYDDDYYDDDEDDVADGQSTVDDTRDGSPTTANVPAQTDTTPRNLDGGGQRYWANADLDFGSEPNDESQNRSWRCEHDFKAYKVLLVETLRKDPVHVDMECVKCWNPIHPEIEAPTSKNGNNLPDRIVPAGAGNMTRGIVRGRCRRNGVHPRRYIPPRGLFRADATIGTAPQLTTTVSSPLSQSVPAREPSPMEDVQYTDRVVDTYGNIIAMTEVETPRRASVDGSLEQRKEEHPRAGKHPMTDSALKSSAHSQIFHSGNSIFSFAYECRYCELLVCSACKEKAIAAQEAKREEDMEEAKKKIEEETDKEKEQQMDALATEEAIAEEKHTDTNTQAMRPTIYD